jgi:hypothetical protein
MWPLRCELRVYSLRTSHTHNSVQREALLSPIGRLRGMRAPTACDSRACAHGYYRASQY